MWKYFHLIFRFFKWHSKASKYFNCMVDFMSNNNDIHELWNWICLFLYLPQEGKIFRNIISVIFISLVKSYSRPEFLASILVCSMKPTLNVKLFSHNSQKYKEVYLHLFFSSLYDLLFISVIFYLKLYCNKFPALYWQKTSLHFPIYGTPFTSYNCFMKYPSPYYTFMACT